MSAANTEKSAQLSVPEMLRIMDVATALRQDRELVEEQLNLDELKARLRDRMLAASKITGEEVTPEEVDAAIAQYYANLHTFKEPKNSVPVAFAHFWVRRRTILRWAGISLGSIALLWWLFLYRNGPLTVTGRTYRQVEKIAKEIARRNEEINAINKDPLVTTEVLGLAAETETYRKQENPEKLEVVLAKQAELESRIAEEYTVLVLPGLGKDRSATTRDHKETSETYYYLVVEAKRLDGPVIPRQIFNEETHRTEEVLKWAERVPKAVYDRLHKDKLDDGILNERAFAVKRRGYLNEEITMPGPDGRPLNSAGRITKW